MDQRQAQGAGYLLVLWACSAVSFGHAQTTSG
jgi:hypothetical protein